MSLLDAQSKEEKKHSQVCLWLWYIRTRWLTLVQSGKLFLLYLENIYNLSVYILNMCEEKLLQGILYKIV